MIMKSRFVSFYSSCLDAVMSFLGFPRNDNFTGACGTPYNAYRTKMVEKENRPETARTDFPAGTKDDMAVNGGYTEVSYSGLEFNFVSDIFPGEDLVAKMRSTDKDNRFSAGNK